MDEMDTRAVRRVKVLDGLFYSFRLLEHHYEAIYPACCRMREQPAMAVVAIANCWGFVDVLHRSRELAQLVPGLGHKQQDLVHFLRSTRLAEEYRHYIQHLRGELATTTHSSPVWGSISWADPDDKALSHTVMVGTQPPGVQTLFSGAVFDTVDRRWVSRVCLGVKESSFNFDPMFDAARRFEAFVVPWIRERAGITPAPAAHLQVVSARILIGELPPNDTMQQAAANVAATDAEH